MILLVVNSAARGDRLASLSGSIGNAPLAEGRVYINRRDGQYFADVPREVWLFTVGGYRVLRKWLDKRDGRALSAVDIDDFAAIATAIEKTIAEVARLDATIAVAGGWSAISM